MKRVTYIISDVDKALSYEWITNHISKEKFELSFILLNPSGSELESFLQQHAFKVYRVTCRGKKDWLKALLQTYRILKRTIPAVVHCHLFQANIIGLTAARIAGVKQRVYTRHHSSLHHIYFPKGVWWDRYCNMLATHVIAISGIVKTILEKWEKVPSRKVVLIPHGFLLQEFSEVSKERVDAVRTKYALQDKFVVGVVSRLTEWKGIQFIIPAFKNFLQIEPNAILLLLNAKGDYERKIKFLLKDIVETNYRLVTFENDMAAAYKCMDVFVHTPIDDHSEAFGQVYVEALASHTPSIFTLSGAAPDFIKDEVNAFVVPFKNTAAIYKNLEKISLNKQLALQVAKQGAKDVAALFPLNKMIQSLEELYEKG